MEKHILSTSLAHIRPVLANIGENIRRYHQLKQMFIEGGEYVILARPAISGTATIEWFGEYDDKLTKLSDYTAAQQVELCGKLKYQINTLYRSVIDYVKGGEQGYDLVKYQELCKTLDACLEIPSLQSVYVTNNQRFILTNWGFIFEKFNAETGIIKKLIPTRITDMTLQALYASPNTQGAVAPNEPLFIEYTDALKEYPDKQLQVVSGNDGQVRLYDVPFFANFKVYQTDEAGRRINLNTFMIDERLATQPYTVRLVRPSLAMPFKIVDTQTNTPLSNIRIFFDVEGTTTPRSSDEHGFIVLNEIPIGMTVRCYQNIEGQPADIHHHTCERGRSEYLIKIKKQIPPPPPPPLPLYFAPIRMHFQTITPSKQPIEQVNLQLMANGQTQELVTDANGDAFLENTALNTPIKVIATYKGKKTEQEFIAESAEMVHQIVIRQQPWWLRWWWLWLLLLLLIAYLAWRWQQPISDSSTLIGATGHQTVRVHVIDSLTQQPLSNARVSLNQSLEQLTDRNGDVMFPNLAKETMVVVYISKNAYGDERREFILKNDKELIVNMLEVSKGGEVGKRGDISLNLKWETIDDIDLMLFDPDKRFINFKDTVAIKGTYKAALDVDANAQDIDTKTNPQENIFAINPINGTYQVCVILYKKRKSQPTNYSVHLTIKGVEYNFKGTLVSEKEVQVIHEFKIE